MEKLRCCQEQVWQQEEQLLEHNNQLNSLGHRVGNVEFGIETAVASTNSIMSQMQQGWYIYFTLDTLYSNVY